MTDKANSSNVNNILRIVQQNWAWAAPLFYIYVTIVGMFQSWLYFNAFGINVFEFSELNDFLLAAFRQPLAFGLLILLILYSILAAIVPNFLNIALRLVLDSERFKDLSENLWSPIKKYLHWHAMGTLWFKKITNVLVIATIVLAAPYFIPHILNDGYSNTWKMRYMQATDRKFRAKFRNINPSKNTDGWVNNLNLIGTTEKYIFFLREVKRNKLNYEVYISPISNVIQIRSERNNHANTKDS